MIRILLTYVLPLLLPLLLYIVWVWLLKRKSSEETTVKPEIKSTGIFFSIVIGIILMIFCVIMLAFLGGEPPGAGQYESPRLENGKIVPPKMF